MTCTFRGSSPVQVRSMLTVSYLFGRVTKGLSKTYQGSQVCTGVRVALTLLRSDCIFSTEVLIVFRAVKIDTTEKKTSKNFIIILRYMSYFVVS